MRTLTLLALLVAMTAACGGSTPSPDGAARDDAAAPDASPSQPDDAGATPDGSSLADAARSHDAAPSNDGAPPIDADNCAKIWSAYPQGTLTIGGGTLAIDVSGLALDTIGSDRYHLAGVYQDGLTGDFEATIDVESATGPDNVDGVSIVLGAPGQDPLFGAEFYREFAIYNTAFEINGPIPSSGTPTESTRATIRFVSTTGMLTMSIDVGNGDVRTATGYTTPGMRLSILASSRGPATRVVLDSFTITGGGAVVSDDFACDSVRH